jgi:ribosomal protein S18 acetylase RimI-like enzyme
MIIRPAELGDLNACFTIDHSYQTDYVWQMEEREEEGHVTVTFRAVRLPRTMRVDYPRDRDYLLDNWQRGEYFLVADQDGKVRGYLDMTVRTWHATGWINNLAVGKRHRRQGIGGALLKAAIEWAREQGLRQLMLETQTKNYPAICFYQKHRFVFCGFNDHYYTNQDIALFFAQSLR